MPSSGQCPDCVTVLLQSKAARGDGYAPLPGDVEAAAAAVPETGRTWTTLFLDACK